MKKGEDGARVKREGGSEVKIGGSPRSVLNEIGRQLFQNKSCRNGTINEDKDVFGFYYRQRKLTVVLLDSCTVNTKRSLIMILLLFFSAYMLYFYSKSTVDCNHTPISYYPHWNTNIPVLLNLVLQVWWGSDLLKLRTIKRRGTL